MTTLYNKIEQIRKDIYEGKKHIENNVENALKKENIKFRQADGKLKEISISIPRSIESSFYLGLRYIKKDNTDTEDGILSQSDGKVITYYKGKQEKCLPEYNGTHKKQTNSNIHSNGIRNVSDFTFVNTVNYYVDL